MTERLRFLWAILRQWPYRNFNRPDFLDPGKKDCPYGYDKIGCKCASGGPTVGGF